MENQIQQTDVTVAILSVGGEQNPKHPNDVQFKVEYLKDFKGEKPLPEGDTITVAKETAEHFEANGFGHIVTDDQPSAGSGGTEGEKPLPEGDKNPKKSSKKLEK